ncbi:MAG: hypothetical protein GDA51_04285 [Ekhidna sp.]|nr:hypothetical protein [Ekhidna sp.]
MLRNLGGFFGVLSSCWLNLQGVENLGGFFGVLSSCWLNLQGVENPWRFFCSAGVSLAKPPRCWETLEVAVVMWSCCLNLQGVEKP